MIKPGMLISDRYEIIEKVGSGGMADVYKALCHRLNRYVAIKILKPEFSSDRSFVNKFRGEAQSAAGLSHPNIVNVYDVGDDEGLHYIVMELVEGITLKKFIERKGKLEVKEAIGISIQIAQGMEAAHANHIIHRDIKPQNIIISKDGKVKVTDFGIAKATTSNTITSNAMGSVHYLSPEQARGGYSDEKSDIYSLGVTMYEMLAGQVPFAGDNNVSVALAHIQGEPVPIRSINPDVPHGVDMIIQKCMQKKPERRYLSVSELIVDLKKAISNPNGDFVQLVAPVVSDSPTISFSSEEINRIKNSSTSNTDVDHQPMGKKDEEDYDDEDDIDAVDPRLTKILIGFGIPVVIVIIILIIVILTKVFGSLKGGTPNKTNETQLENLFEDDSTPTPSIEVSETLEMIDVVNMTKEDAIAKLKELSDKFEITFNEDYSESVESGKVMEQFPEKNSNILSDGKIVLTISTGLEEFLLDDYINEDYEKAKAKMLELGLTISKSEDYDAKIEAGKIISTIPDAGSPVSKGTEIVVVVSKGSEQITVPKLVGLTEEKAKQAIKEAGLILGEITRSSSDKYDEGIVKYQSYSEGEKVKAETKIDISISTGPEEEPENEPTSEPSQPSVETPEGEGDSDEDETEVETEVEDDATYVGTLVIEKSPFASDEESGQVQLDLKQNSGSRLVFSGKLSGKDFPKTFHIESDSPDLGTITMYIDQVQYTDATWQISFSKE